MTDTRDASGGLDDRDKTMTETNEGQQRTHYDRIVAEYDRHYGDETAREYRRAFIYEPMFDGIDLRGAQVLEAMCGSGQATEFLIGRGAHVTGLDISHEAIATFRARWPSCDALCASLLDVQLPEGGFDVVVVIGGLHHLHPNVDRAIRTIRNALRRGGRLCFAEPHRGSLLDWARRLWYRLDPRMFAEGEAALDIRGLRERHRSEFAYDREQYFGSGAYFLTLNSMVLRIPVRLKTLYTPACMRLESMLSAIQGAPLSAGVICVWRKL
jgi:SAM-dependent methyltransferase